MQRTRFFAGIIMAVALAFIATTAAAQSNPTIAILSPKADSNVPVGDVNVVIATENFTLDQDHHWHLYVDGELRSMVGNGATSWTTRIATSGPHEIKASLADATHEELASATIYVTAAPVEPLTAPFNTGPMAIIMGIFAAAVVGLIILAVRLKPRHL